MPTTIVNASPATKMLGIHDFSSLPLAVPPDQLPTHLPKIYLYAQKGPTTPQLVGGDGLTQMYGADTFDTRKKFFNHQTALSVIMSARGNAQMIERMIPSDAGPKANFLLSLDVIAKPIQQYQRNSDGTIKVDVLGAPVPVTGGGATLPGFLCKWVITNIDSTKVINTVNAGPAVPDSSTFGVAVSAAGDQTYNATTSTRYPILEFWASSYGSDANNAGFRIFAPTITDERPVNTNVMSAVKAYPFRLVALKRAAVGSTPTITSALDGSMALDFVLKPSAINPYTDGLIHLNDTFPTFWGNTNIPGYQPIYADLGNVKVYQSNIDTVLNLLYTAEKAYTGAGSDFTAGATDEMYKFNLFSGKSSSGAAYYTFALNTADANAVQPSSSTNFYANGGADGTMSDTLFAGLVSTYVAKYNDPTSIYQDTVTYPESHLYDTGFPLATKKSLLNFIAIRKDTFTRLSCYDTTGPEMSAADEAAVAVALRTQAQLYPESVYFGTNTVRCTIDARYGKCTALNYAGKLPLTIEQANKAAKLMGASNGTWKPENLYDHGDNAVVELFDVSTLNAGFVPETARNKDWANGINYPQPYTRRSMSYQANRTVYDTDSSVLTSYITACVFVELEKIGMAVWREFTGVISMTPAQLCEAVNASVIRRCAGKFAGLVKIVPQAYISGGDAKRGYSWTLPIAVGANNSMTVMTLELQAYRMAQLAALTK